MRGTGPLPGPPNAFGFEAPRSSGRREPVQDSVPVALHFVVTADAQDGCLVIRGDRIGQAPLELRLDLA